MSAQLDSVKRPAPGPPLPPKGTELATPPRPPPVISYQNVSDTSLIELDSPSHEQNESQGSGHSNYSNLVEFDPLAPLSATPPPLKPPPDVTGYEDVNSLYGHKYEDVEVEPQTDFYVASHAFGKDGPSFLTMKFGQVVKVKQKCDLTGNAEWWLVEDRDGRAGYVPANRLQKYTQ
ncbi:hypothetical protein HDE_13287 [Halotydeus destructor]|nr:hypothetical protein HDE_13287 [Halotydeus destructor]